MKAVAVVTYRTTPIKKITRKLSWVIVRVPYWPLALVLAFQILFSWIFLQNTAFQDEALYIYAGRQIIQHWMGSHVPIDDYSFYFSGNPYVYPIIGGAIDMLGGLELVRAFSMLCMLIVTTCGYYITRHLFDKKSALFAAIFFVCQAPVLFLSRLSTYDPLCLCLIALATALAVHGARTRQAWHVLGIGPLLVLAFGAKYAALLFMPPVFALLVLYTLIVRGWLAALIRMMIAGVSFALAAALAAYVVLHFDRSMLHALGATTTNRLIVTEYSRTFLIENVLQFVGLSYLVALLSLLFVRGNKLLLIFLLVGASLLVPAYHIYEAEFISLDKHLGFSMFFLMPVGGYALAYIAGFRQKVALPDRALLLSSLSICLLFFLFLTPLAQFMYGVWPPTDKLTDALKTQTRLGEGHYLAEQFEVSRYNLRDKTYNWQWIGLDFFQYTDKQGHYYFGSPAYVKAIDDGYFDVVQLNYGYNVSIDVLIAQAIARNHEYKLIDKVPYRDVYGSGYYWIWAKR